MRAIVSYSIIILYLMADSISEAMMVLMVRHAYSWVAFRSISTDGTPSKPTTLDRKFQSIWLKLFGMSASNSRKCRARVFPGSDKIVVAWGSCMFRQLFWQFSASLARISILLEGSWSWDIRRSSEWDDETLRSPSSLGDV